IAASVIDPAVWSRIEALLRHPDVVIERLRQLPIEDTSTAELELIGEQVTRVERQRLTLLDNLTLLTGRSAEDAAGKLKRLDDELDELERERQAALRRRAEWESAQTRLQDVELWVRRVAAKLDRIDYHHKRLAIDWLGVVVRVWKDDRRPRWE